VLVLGVAYKADVGDVRESPAIPVMRGLAKRGAVVGFNDPFVQRVTLNGSVLECEELEPAIAHTDLVVLLTPHSGYGLDRIASQASILFDTRNAYGASRRANVIPL
jgi:UDP-N-acetyl-D-glucosamine dehydrogenase